MSNYPNGPAGMPPSASGSGNGTLILVLGILSLICLPILGPVAWIMGNNALASGVNPSQAGNINAGRICGIIGTVFLVIGVIYGILIVTGAVAGFHHAASMPGATPAP
jgi:hypothetical protein